MNAGQSYNLESLFGPPSDPVSITKFLLEATKSQPSSEVNIEQTNQELEEECSVEDIKTVLKNTWSDPLLAASLIKEHTHTVSVLSSAGSTRANKSTRNAQRASQTSSDDLVNLQKNLQSISLSSWRLNADAVHFMRTPKNSDFNVLQRPKAHGEEIGTFDRSTAVLSVSVYNRVLWGPSYATRSSQHAMLSSQTLGDLCDIIPCVYKNMPSIPNEQVAETDGCFLCIEGTVYGDGATEQDYAAKLTAHLDALTKNDQTIRKAATSLNNTMISSLTLRINEPYWLVHRGNCEHFIVIDQIRLLHPSDRHSRFPLTLQITPPLLDLCRSCQRVPAVVSIVGDVRLGESPSVLCTPCWKQMGAPPPDAEVVVLSLPKYNAKP